MNPSFDPPLSIAFCAAKTSAAPWLEAIRALLPQARVVEWTADDPVQSDYAIVWAPEPAFFETQRHLKAIFSLGAGVDSLLRIDHLPAGVPVVRLGDAGMSVQMAEYVCHAVIRFSREFAQFETAMKEDEHWTFRKPTSRADYPVGVMGLGVIGARVASALASFEFPVFGWSNSQKSIAAVQCLAGGENLDRFLEQCRILVCVLPLTPETENILNLRNLSRLKPEGYLINVARGRHLVEEDLLTLLDDGRMAGATLDVFREEPLPAGHPFWKHPRIILTPHISARTLRTRSIEQIVEKIHRHRRGESIDGIVDTQRGY